MKGVTTIVLVALLIVVAPTVLAAPTSLTVQEWTVTYFPALQPDCAWACLGEWLQPTDDSAKVHYIAVSDDGVLQSLTADTTVFK